MGAVRSGAVVQSLARSSARSSRNARSRARCTTTRSSAAPSARHQGVSRQPRAPPLDICAGDVGLVCVRTRGGVLHHLRSTKWRGWWGIGGSDERACAMRACDRLHVFGYISRTWVDAEAAETAGGAAARTNSRKTLSRKKASSATPATALSRLNQPQLPNEQTQAPKWPCPCARCQYPAATRSCHRPLSEKAPKCAQIEKKRHGRRGASPLRNTSALPPPPDRSPSALLPLLRLSHHRTSPRDAPVSTRKTERRARDAREQQARGHLLQPCGAQKHPSPQKCDRLSPTRSVHLGALAQGRRQQPTTVRLRSRHHNHSRSLALPPLSPPSPRAPLYPRALWKRSRSSRLRSAPCQSRDCEAFALALASKPQGHTSALSCLSTLQKDHEPVGSG